MVKNREINGTEEIALVTPTPGWELLSKHEAVIDILIYHSDDADITLSLHELCFLGFFYDEHWLSWMIWS